MTGKYKLSAAAISAILLGGGLYFFSAEEKPPEVEQKKIVETKPVQGFGIVDLERIKAKHPDGEELKNLVAREKRLKLELEAAMTPYKPPQENPEFEEKPFDEAAKEKNMQVIMEKFSALKAKKVQLAEKFTAESREEYLRRRDEVRDKFLNEALNINLKLQNADNLRLTSEEIQNLQAELTELTRQRNLKQKEMLDAWTAEINQRVEQATAEEEAQARAEAKQLREQSTVDADKKIQEVQERNKNSTEKINSEIESRQKRRRELAEEIAEVSKQREELENKILSSIVEQVGKLGALYKLEMVFVKNDLQDLEIFSRDFDFFDFKISQTKNLMQKKFGAKIFSANGVVDLTNDLIKEMELKGTAGGVTE